MNETNWIATKPALKTIEIGNGDVMLRGVAQMDGRYTAHTGSRSKTFKTERGAVAWLRRNGIGQDGRLLPLLSDC